MGVHYHKVAATSAIALLGLLTILALHSPLKAQSFYGSVVGTVTDPSDAVIPGAAVTLTNIGTNEKRTAVTDAAGNYRFVNLVPANYRLEVENTGFKRMTREPITVQVGGEVRINATLEVGAQTETVTVEANTPLLQTDSSSLSTTIQGAQVQEIPLNGRNVENLIALAPGVVPTGGSQGSTGLNQGTRTAGGIGWGNYQIGGGIQGQSANYIDGTPNNILGGSAGGNQIALVPTQDAVQEFNVASSNAGADFGRFAGGVVNMTTKSGTNAFHGGVYEYFRNNVLNANDFFSNKNGSPRVQWNQNQYGATLNGPIKRDKAFFMFTWEGLSIHTASINATNVPTADMQNGVFTVPIRDPLGICSIDSTSQPGKWIITNLYKGNCGDPTNKILKTYYPLPNASGTSNWFSTIPITNNQNQYNGRVDYTVSSKQRLFGRYTYWNTRDHAGWRFDQKNIGPSGEPWAIGGNYTPYIIHQFVMGDSYAFNGSTVLDVRVNYVRETSENVPYDTNVDESQFGPAYVALAPQMSVHTLPVFNASGGIHSLYSMAGFQGYFINWWNNYGINANLVKIVGPHSFKFGAEFRLMDNSAAPNANRLAGLYVYNTTYTGSEFASMLMGYPSQIQFQTIATNGNYTYYQAYYATDTWQATRKLTLNLGLRYELPGAVAERKDRATVLLPDAVDPYTGIRGTQTLVNSPLYDGRTTVAAQYKQFAPRVGFAYRVTPATVIRGGYGISYLPNDIHSGAMPYNSLVNLSVTTTNITGALPTPLQTALLGIVATGLNQPIGRTQPDFMVKQGYASKTSYMNQAILGPVPYQSYPYTQQWNGTLSHEFKGNWMAEFAYIGLRGTHLPGIGSVVIAASNRNLNQLDSQYFSQGAALLNPATSCAAAPGLVGSRNFTVGQCLRPYPYYNNLADTSGYYAYQNYQSLQAKAEKRFGSSGVLMANYTWAKNKANTDVQPVNTFVESKPAGANGMGLLQDFNNLAGEYSLLSYDVTHRVVVSYVLKLPFGKGQKFGSSYSGAAGALVSGWAINGITTFQSGFPLALITATQNRLQTSFGAGVTRPNQVPGCEKVIGGSGLDRVNAKKWFNTACFQYPGDYAFGNEPRIDPELRADGIKNFDFAVQKSTALRESTNLEFRAEFFNIFNRVQFSAPITSVGAANFGQVPQQGNRPRQIQFSLRLTF